MIKTLHSVEHKILLNLLKGLRHSKGLTQLELSNLLDVPQSFVSKYELGERRLDIIELRSICRKLDIDFLKFIKSLEKQLI